jgi:hypothetical protein
MYGWRARIGNISPTACAEILLYEFYRVAPEGVTFVSTTLVIRDARESTVGGFEFARVGMPLQFALPNPQKTKGSIFKARLLCKIAV